MLNAAISFHGLRILPGNRLEQLEGGRKGKFSLRVNDQWCICFKLQDGNTIDVEIVNYHGF